MQPTGITSNQKLYSIKKKTNERKRQKIIEYITRLVQTRLHYTGEQFEKEKRLVELDFSDD